jgi:hypothetical protein
MTAVTVVPLACWLIDVSFPIGAGVAMTCAFASPFGG